VNVKEVVTSGGLIQPGDAVDVVAIFQRIDTNPDDPSFLVSASSGGPKRIVAVTLLQNVQVLAVAQKIDDPLSQPSDKNAIKPQPDAKSVTLAVTPDDAERLFIADETAALRLSLRRFGEHDTQPVQTADNNVP